MFFVLPMAKRLTEGVKDAPRQQMKRLLTIAVATVAAMAIWTVLVAVGAREGWFRSLPAARGDTAGFLAWAEGRYAVESRGNIAIVLLQRGHVAETYFASHGRPVDGDSLFQIASMSKWVTAWGVMRLAETGRIDLDAPVSRYLTRWRLPPSSFNNDDVTIRRLLSHSAGLTDGLGFRGYVPGEPLPTVEQELTRASDALPGASGVVRVGARPGSTWRYSGGGYLVLQLLVEEVTHQPFNTYMQTEVLRPLGMTHSTFVDPDPNRLADFYAPDGALATHYRFTALGAASLYTSPADFTRFVQAQVRGPDGAPPGRGVLSPATIAAMRTPHAFLYGLPVWGLGESLYAPDGSGSFVIGHDGGNFPAINTTARIDPATGDGVIVLETGSATLAREIGGEWLHWRTGKVGLDTLVVFDQRNILIALASGALVIVIGMIALVWVERRRRYTALSLG
ncbi:MAG TPA: serine hydrolase domain-containing protein [Caulobacterales bacterium]|nr:serine hydrolase domain-containing protein [Caulobacterales bacterium]